MTHWSCRANIQLSSLEIKSAQWVMKSSKHAQCHLASCHLLLLWNSVDAVKPSAASLKGFTLHLLLLHLFSMPGPQPTACQRTKGETGKEIVPHKPIPSHAKSLLILLSKIAIKSPLKAKIAIVKLQACKTICVFICSWKDLSQLNHYLIANFFLEWFFPFYSTVEPCCSIGR